MSDTGWDRAETGIDRSYEAAPDDWKEDAELAVYRTAKELRYLTADDVWERFPEDDGSVNRSALGHIMRTAKKNGWIESTGTQERAKRPSRHCCHRPVWRSLIYEAAKPLSQAVFEFAARA
jgi:hypothetical protein